MIFSEILERIPVFFGEFERIPVFFGDFGAYTCFFRRIWKILEDFRRISENFGRKSGKSCTRGLRKWKKLYPKCPKSGKSCTRGLRKWKKLYPRIPKMEKVVPADSPKNRTKNPRKSGVSKKSEIPKIPAEFAY